MSRLHAAHSVAANTPQQGAPRVIRQRATRTIARLATAATFMLLMSACGGSDSSTAPTPNPNPNPNPGPAPVASVQLSPAASAIDVGGTQALTATVRDAQQQVLTGRTITFTSNATQFATVSDQGVVTGVAAGQATITASSEGKSTMAVITVRPSIASLEIAGTLDSLEVTEERALLAIARDAAGTPIPAVPVTWTSSNQAVATVSAEGVVTGADRGTVTITATAGGKVASVTRVVVIRYRSLALGTTHACNLSSGGVAWCWGLNGTDARLGEAQVGDGIYRATPVRVPGNHRFTQLVTFARFTCGLTMVQKAYCWGNNGWGALGSGSNVGYSATPLAVAGNHSFVSLSAGIDHACGMTAANQTYCWGHNDWGQFGIGSTTSMTTPVLAATGLALQAIEAGPAYSCGITMTGAAHCWGSSGLGQLGDGTQISYGNTFRNTPVPVAGNLQFKALSLGYTFACGLTMNGSAYCWGSNGGKLGDGTTADASSPRLVQGGHTFVQLSSGSGRSCAVTAANDIYCWGSNGYGELGAAGGTARSPILSAGGLKAAEVAVAGIGTGAGGFTCAVSKDRLSTYCWGRNDFGQVGNGATAPASTVNPTPSQVVGQKPN